MTAYRTTQLRLTHPDHGFGTNERNLWQTAPNWQPIRRAVELALIEFDWDRALVITNLVVKPVADLLLLDQLSRQAVAVGAQLDALVLENLWRDSRRSQRWTRALIGFLNDVDAGNHTVLQTYLDEFAPLGHTMIDAGADMIAATSGRDAAQIASDAHSDWAALLAPNRLHVTKE